MLNSNMQPRSAAPTDPVVFINTARDSVQAWVERHAYRGYEPFDGLMSYLRPLTFGTQLGDQLLQQVGRQSPFNLRPLLGIRPQESTKGRGYMAWGYLHKFVNDGDAESLVKAEQALDWLDRNKSKLYAKHSWGNVFDYVSRNGHIPRDESTIVWTGLIAQAYLEAFERTGNERWLKIADSACSWILDLPRENTKNGVCLSYVAYKQNSVHNANMLGAAALVAVSRTHVISVPNVGFTAIAGGLMWFVLGFVLYALVYAAGGSLVSRQELQAAIRRRRVVLRRASGLSLD